MPTIEVTKDNFEDVVLGADTALVDFWAEWCAPCRAFGPVFEKAATDNPDMVFAKVDTEAQRELASYFNIRSIPTLMVFRDRVLLYSQPGALPAASLDQLIEQVRAVDMDEVHRQIAEESESEAATDEAAAQA